MEVMEQSAAGDEDHSSKIFEILEIYVYLCLGRPLDHPRKQDASE